MNNTILAFLLLVMWPVLAEAVTLESANLIMASRICEADPDCQVRWDRVGAFWQAVGLLVAGLFCLLLFLSIVGYFVDWARCLGAKKQRGGADPSSKTTVS